MAKIDTSRAIYQLPDGERALAYLDTGIALTEAELNAYRKDGKVRASDDDFKAVKSRQRGHIKQAKRDKDEAP